MKGNFTARHDARTGFYALRAMLLKHAVPRTILLKFGMKAGTIPTNEGDTALFRRLKPLDVSTAEIIEGINPTPDAIEYEDVSLPVAQYGKIVQQTKRAVDLSKSPDKAYSSISKLLGENAAQTIELLMWGKLKAGLNVFYDTLAHTSRAEIDSVISLDRLRAVTRFLDANFAAPVTSIIDGSTKVGTKPVQAAYIAIAHTDLAADIRDLAGFIPVAEYGSRTPVDDCEIGSVENIRFCLSAYLKPIAGAGATSSTMLATGGKANVYPVLVFGDEAYGHTPFDDPEAIVPNILDTADKSDVMNLMVYASWLTYFCGGILNENWIARFEVAAKKI